MLRNLLSYQSVRTALLLVLLGTLANWLIGCATSPPVYSCPALVEYDEDFEQKLADELSAAGSGFVWPTALVDYYNLRARLWECQ